MQQLLDKSLLNAEETAFGTLRYFMLESVWEYARAKLLESGEGEWVRGRHLDYFLRLAEDSESKLAGPEQSIWLEKLTAEHGNLRFALRWSAQAPEAVERGLRMAGALARYWDVRSHLQEGYEHCVALLVRPESQLHTDARRKALTAAGRLAWCQDHEAIARGHYEEALAIAYELGDARETALLEAQLGFVEWSDHSDEAAKRYFESALAYGRKSADELTLAMASSGLGSIARQEEGDSAKARELKAQSLVAYSAIGDKWIVGLINFSIAANVAMDQGDYEAARTTA